MELLRGLLRVVRAWGRVSLSSLYDEELRELLEVAIIIKWVVGGEGLLMRMPGLGVERGGWRTAAIAVEVEVEGQGGSSPWQN